MGDIYQNIAMTIRYDILDLEKIHVVNLKCPFLLGRERGVGELLFYTYMYGLVVQSGAKRLTVKLKELPSSFLIYTQSLFFLPYQPQRIEELQLLTVAKRCFCSPPPKKKSSLLWAGQKISYRDTIISPQKYRRAIR